VSRPTAIVIPLLAATVGALLTVQRLRRQDVA